MNQILQISDDPVQRKKIILPDGSSMSLLLKFVPMQYGWFIDELVYGSFTIQGIRVCNSFNILHQFKNKIPFGIACITTGREPTHREDFSSGTSKLYIISSSEVKQYAGFLSGQV